MTHYTRFIGLDVHKDTIAIAVAARDGPPAEFVGRIPNRDYAVQRWLKRHLDISRQAESLFCYEAGPCGYELYRLLKGQGIACQVIAPGMTPQKPNERIKTDRLDAIKLATFLRSGHLTPIWVPDEQHEAFRCLLRMRRRAAEDRTRFRHRLTKFLLTKSVHPADRTRNWSKQHTRWLDTLTWSRVEDDFAFREMRHQIQEATDRIARIETSISECIQSSPLRPAIETLQCLKGFALITSATVCAEIGDIRRFEQPTSLMGYSGLIPGVYQSANTIRQRGITKAGNVHLRDALIEASWAYRYPPKTSQALASRQRNQSPEAIRIGFNAQTRLHKRYRYLLRCGKHHNKVIVAIARELLGFVWELLMTVPPSPQSSLAA